MARLKADFAGERRTAYFGFQLSPSERVELERRARKRGLVLAEFVRDCCFQAASKAAVDHSRRGSRDATGLLIVSALGRVGNNLNQLAKHANQNGSVEDSAALRDAITELKAALARIV